MLLKNRIKTFCILPLFLLFVSLFSVNCSGPELDDQTVALVNHEKITRDELEYSLNFFPQYTASHKGGDAVSAHLNLLIDKKLFAREGRRKGFDRTEHVRKVVEWVKRDEMIRALYRDVVRSKINITEDEIRQAFVKGLTSYRVRHIFVRTEEQAWQVKQALQSGVPFEEIARQTFQDSTLRANGGDLGFLTLSEMDKDFADAVASLKIGQISDPVRTRWGYHIIRVEDQRQRVFSGKTELEQMRKRIERDLRRQKENELAGEYVQSVMDKLNVRMSKEAFNLFAAEVKKTVIQGQQMLPDYRPVFGGVELQKISEGVKGIGDKTLITFNGGQWTIAEFMAKVRALPVTKRPRLDSPNKLINDIGKMVRNEFLFREAQKRHLDRDPTVQAEVKKWRDDFTFGELWQSIVDTMTVTEKEIADFHRTHRSRYIMPDRVHVKEILVATKKEAESLLRRIRNGESFDALARQYSLRSWAAKKGGDLGFIMEGEYGNISRRAMTMKSGEIAGPVLVREGYAIIQCLAHQPARPMTLEEARQKVRKDVKAEKENKLYQSMSRSLRANARIKINEPLLAEIKNEFEKTRNVPTVFRPIKK